MARHQFNHPSAPALIETPVLNGITELASPVARTATANLTGVDFVNSGEVAMKAILNVGTTSGTTPTLDVKIQESADNSTYTDVVGGAFTQVTAAAAPQLLSFTRTKRYLRAVYTIAGTTPSFVASVTVGY